MHPSYIFFWGGEGWRKLSHVFALPYLLAFYFIFYWNLIFGKDISILKQWYYGENTGTFHFHGAWLNAPSPLPNIWLGLIVAARRVVAVLQMTGSVTTLGCGGGGQDKFRSNLLKNTTGKHYG